MDMYSGKKCSFPSMARIIEERACEGQAMRCTIESGIVSWDHRDHRDFTCTGPHGPPAPYVLRAAACAHREYRLASNCPSAWPNKHVRPSFVSRLI
eukprot:1142799-Pelagomonas_calceolata.AAC.1